jgi:hypothetical protein
MLLYQAEFLRELNDVYADEGRSDLDNRTLLRQITEPILENDKHIVIISHVTNPCDLQFQLRQNVPQLESLMDKLERQYYGIGATTFSMPDEYIITGRLCVGIYPIDGNWHRCEIVQVFANEKKVKIYFMDYGGYSTVDFHQVKFLRREFGELPVQALNAKLANIKFRKNKNVKDETVINYMLSRVMGRPLEATILGVIDDDVFCLELVDRTTQDHGSCPAGTPISLNTRVIMDGYGESCDDTKKSGVSYYIL